MRGFAFCISWSTAATAMTTTAVTAKRAPGVQLNRNANGPRRLAH